MNALLIDIRTREEYDRSHWKGALSMPMDITDSMRVNSMRHRV